MSEKRIRINVKGAMSAPYLDLVNFQGDLKILTESAYQSFKSNMIKNGFIEPISVWIDSKDGDRLKMLNGHQRLATVKRMVEKEGYEVAYLPLSVVEAESLEDAKMKLLALTSEYGEMSQDGLVNFLSDLNMHADEIQSYLKESARLTRVNVDDVMAQIRDLKIEIATPDALDVGNIVVGGETAPAMPTPADKPVKNDAQTGLRLVQIFLTDEQLVGFKLKTDAIMKAHKLDNLTEAIIKAVELTADNGHVETNEKNPNIKLKKSKK